MTPLFKKILGIVRKTGDRCIVLDPGSEDAFVVMDLGSYETLLGKTEARLTDFFKRDIIEPDIAVTGNKPQDDSSFAGLDMDNFPEPNEQKIMEDERFYLEPID